MAAQRVAFAMDNLALVPVSIVAHRLFGAEEIDEAQAEAAQAEADQMNAQIEAQMAINSAKEQDIANREIAKQEAKNG